MNDGLAAERLIVRSNRARWLLRGIVALTGSVLGIDIALRLPEGDFDLPWNYAPLVHVNPVFLAVAVVAVSATFLWLSQDRVRRASQAMIGMLFLIEFVGSMVFFPQYRNFVLFQLPLLGTPRSAAFWICIMTFVNTIVYLVGWVGQGSGMTIGIFDVEHLMELFAVTFEGLFIYALTIMLFTEAELHRRLRDAQAQLAMHAREQERQALTLELHDSLGHHMTALRMQLLLALRRAQDDGRERLAQALATVERLLAELRSLVEARSEHDVLPLEEKLQALVGAIVRPSVSISIDADLPMPGHAVEKALFRVCQEALTNAIRHSEAERLEIQVAMSGERLRLTIRDDGCGCAALQWGNGLRGMAERVERCGGVFSIQSKEGAGVTITAEFRLEGLRP